MKKIDDPLQNYFGTLSQKTGLKASLSEASPGLKSYSITVSVNQGDIFNIQSL